jgi:hypothetical protein
MIRNKLIYFREPVTPVFLASLRQRSLRLRTSTYLDLTRKFGSQNGPKEHSSFPTKASQNAITWRFSPGCISSGVKPSTTLSPLRVIGDVFYRTDLLARHKKLPPLTLQIRWRAIHSIGRRENESPPHNEKRKDNAKGPVKKETLQDIARDPPVTENADLRGTNSYFNLPHMPKMPHRPTKEELLAAATGFWSRLRVRFKWFSIRSLRPWNIDDWSAFISWVMVGHIVWILVGTTTFFSLLIFAIKTVVAQGEFPNSWHTGTS